MASLSLDDYETVIKVNQVGVFLGMKSVVPAMRERGKGSIVNISSGAGISPRQSYLPIPRARLPSSS
jgi:3alpha(or 20beta)-hydroxysteroid dehydrogenase